MMVHSNQGDEVVARSFDRHGWLRAPFTPLVHDCSHLNEKLTKFSQKANSEQQMPIAILLIKRWLMLLSPHYCELALSLPWKKCG